MVSSLHQTIVVRHSKPAVRAGMLLSISILFILIICSLAAPAHAAETPEAGQPPLIPLDAVGEPVVWCYHGQVPDTRLVVVDKSRQRMLVLRYLGKLGLEYEYPCASGERSGPKSKARDEKTPEGVYFVTHRYRDRKVTIFGDRALHLNYPNPQDRAQGRKGNGIYIHGTNKDYKPRSSNGCLVMTNSDLARVEPLLNEQFTPVIVVQRMALPSPALQNQACEYLRTLELAALGQEQAPLPHGLELLIPLKGNTKLPNLSPELSRLGPGLKVYTQGLALFGAGDQWVLLANQIFQGRGRKKIAVTRRFYLQGVNPSALKLVQVQWVLPNVASARLLASWAPPKPVAVAAAPGRKADPEAQIQAMLKGWLAAWQKKQLKQYMTYYARSFQGSGKNWRQWRKYKAYLNRVYKKITVSIKDVKIQVHGKTARVEFVQYYQSDWHRDVGLKRLELALVGNRWLIRSETWQKLPAPKNKS